MIHVRIDGGDRRRHRDHRFERIAAFGQDQPSGFGAAHDAGAAATPRRCPAVWRDIGRYASPAGARSASPRRFKQRVGRRQPSAERHIKRLGIARAAGGIDMVAQLARGRRIEDIAGLLEGAEGIGVEHFRPHITVIGRRIAAAGKDMPEMRRAVAHDDFVRHADARHFLFLERA